MITMLIKIVKKRLILLMSKDQHTFNDSRNYSVQFKEKFQFKNININ